jgi:hypothetical protein
MRMRAQIQRRRRRRRGGSDPDEDDGYYGSQSKKHVKTKPKHRKDQPTLFLCRPTQPQGGLKWIQ